jgi:hypothetical protein
MDEKIWVRKVATPDAYHAATWHHVWTSKGELFRTSLTTEKDTSATLRVRAWVDTLFVLGRLEECPMRAPSFHSAQRQATDSTE